MLDMNLIRNEDDVKTLKNTCISMLVRRRFFTQHELCFTQRDFIFIRHFVFNGES